MKVYLLQDVERVGMKGEVVKVEEGFARNFLIPRKIAVEITPKNEAFYKNKELVIERRKEVVESKTSMLAERIKMLKITIKRKMHDDGKLYGSIGSAEIAEALTAEALAAGYSLTVGKSQIIIDKAIKAKGSYDVTVKLSNKLQPQIKVVVTSL